MLKFTSILSGFALLAVPVASIAHSVFKIEGAVLVLAGAMIGFVLLQLANFNRTAWIILGGCILAGGLAAIFVDDTASAFLRGSQRSGLVVSIFAAGAVLRRVAEQSDLIRRCGRHLIEQPPGRRYGALSFGTSALGVFMSFGCVNLLGPMIRQTRDETLRGEAARIEAARERRGMVAILRGFCISPVWSPISIAFVFGLSYAPGANPLEVIILAVICGFCLLCLGWFLDAREDHGLRPTPPVRQSGDGWGIQLRLLALIMAILGSILAAIWLLDLRLIDAVIICLPLSALTWLALQAHSREKPLAFAGHSLFGMLRDQFPSYRTEVMILASAGIAGTLIAAALPLADLADGLRGLALPGAVIPLIIITAMALGGQIAMNAVLSATIVGSILPEPALLGAHPSVVAASYMIAWGITVSSSPFSLSTLMISSIHQTSPRTIAYGWNGRFVILAFLFAAIYTIAASWILQNLL